MKGRSTDTRRLLTADDFDSCISLVMSAQHKRKTPSKEAHASVSLVDAVEHSDDDKDEELPAKRHACEYCDYHTDRKWSLTTHMRTHTGAKPYRCETCGTCFSTSGTLIKHIRTHSE